MSFEGLDRLADAILYEGYVLYPYRASAAKNQLRWQFGIVAPRSPNDDGEPWFSQTECLVEPSERCRLFVRVRFLRPQAADANNHRSAAATWLDAVPYSIDVGPIDLVPGRVDDFPLEASGLEARLTVQATEIEGTPLVKTQLRVENLTPWRESFVGNRDALLCASLASAHLLLQLEGGTFVSLLDPPEAATAAAGACVNRHTWPVLVGDRTRRDVMLSSPIVLYDYPAIAAESPGDLCDGTEIDEILSLRVLTLTDREKAEARATDARAARIIDRVDALTPDAWQTLHGTMRSADFFNPPDEPSPNDAFVVANGQRIERGTHVRLRPTRRADAMDMFFRDQAATVSGVFRDVDDRVYVAVTVDADPAATLHETFGRYFYFDPSEVELLAPKQEESS